MSSECAARAPKTKRLRSALYVRSIELAFLPKFESQGDGVDFDCLPPSRLVAPPVKLTVVRTTERHGELVADPSTEGAGLSEAQMVRVARGAPAHETGLACDEFPVFFIAQADALLQDRPPLRAQKGRGCRRGGGPWSAISSWIIVWGIDVGRGLIEFRQPLRKRALDRGRVSRRQTVLGGQVAVGPHGRIVRGAEALKLGDQSIPQFRRLLRVKGQLWRDRCARFDLGSAGPYCSIASRLALRTWDSSVGWAELGLWCPQVGRIEIVFASDADQGEERIPILREIWEFFLLLSKTDGYC